MIQKRDKNEIRRIRHERVRKKISGTAERPRFCVYRSLKNIYVQVIDDTKGVTLCQASTLDKEIKPQLESVDKKVFAYCSQSVYEVKEKLYQVEELSEMLPFMRISKSMIINLDKIRHISPTLGGRFEALLDNDEKVIISRQYVPLLKDKLGVNGNI